MTLSDMTGRILCDAACEDFRRPLGALPTGRDVTLSFADPDGLVRGAQLLIGCDDWEHTAEMTGGDGRWVVTLTPCADPCALRYRFRLQTAMGELWLGPDSPDGRFGTLTTSRGDGFRLTVYDGAFTTPDWLRRSVIYQIFPDRFARDGSDTAQRGIAHHRAMGRNVKFHEGWDEAVDWQPNSAEGFYFPLDFYGGTLRGIEENLPYIQSLGVSCIYLNPIVEACSNHRYDTADYLTVDPILGSNQDMERLCARAKELGIRIMLDGVFSHTGADSRYFNKFGHYNEPGACQGTQSPYYDWYDFRSFPDDYRCWWNFPDLPEVDEENAAWQDFVVSGEHSVVKTWLRRGASAWRLDVADELPDDALSLIRAAAKSVSPDAVVLGEVWEDAVTKTSYGKARDYALGASLDSVMNYPLRAALIDFFTFRSDARTLAAFLLCQRLNYPAPLYYSLMNLTGSHDTERIRTALATRIDAKSLTQEQQSGFLVADGQDARGAAMQRLFAAVQYAIPGAPCFYYGDETGMNGMLDPFDRAPFTTGRHPIADTYAALAALRAGADALTTGAAAFFAPDPDVLCVLRCISGGRDVFGESARDGAYLICVNRSRDERRFVADLWRPNAGLTSSELAGLKASGVTGGACLLTGRHIAVSEGLCEIELPGETACFFALK
jgi:glycosidase